MRNVHNMPRPGELEIVSTICQRALNARLAELRMQDDLTIALREALKLGISADDLSAETGYSVARVRKMAARDLTFGDDVAELAGISR